MNEIIAKIEGNLLEPVAKVLMIKGPQGIGKSRSIVNIIRKLQFTGNYLVTFIPDCENWNTFYDLIEAICSSCGYEKILSGTAPYAGQATCYGIRSFPSKQSLRDVFYI